MDKDIFELETTKSNLVNKCFITIPDGCKEITLEKIDNTVVIIFEPKKEPEEWYPKDDEVVYIPSITTALGWESDYFKDIISKRALFSNRALFKAGFIFKTKEEAIEKTNQILGDNEK